MERSVFGTMFDRVVVINLDRRADRMSSVQDQLGRLGIGYTRHAATDGKDMAVARDWQNYFNAPVVSPDNFRPVLDWRDFYLGDKPHIARVAFFEKERSTRALATSGAWGLFLSMREVIEKALADKVERLLILEDDVRFHRDTVDLWPLVLSELPEDWQILQLGSMQLHWDDSWIEWHSQHLYKCNGSSFAGHAFALKPLAMRAILQRSKVLDLPFDIGALQEAKRIFRDQCFTAYPNIAIQDTQDSEIGMSLIFDEEAKKKVNKYRWVWEDYTLADLRPVGSSVGGKSDAIAPDEAPQNNYLQPYDAEQGSVERVIVVFGPETAETAEAFIGLLKEQKERGEIAPIVLIDDLAYIPSLRHAELAFEYVPTLEDYEKIFYADALPLLVVERRLSIIRRKWLPRRIMALGPKGHARLETWRASPFEQAEFGADLAFGDDLCAVME
jgi:GR25 family glycosyltransferase involved in LPS biosynthesis